MSTLDVVNQAGGQAANFLDVGGGAGAKTIANALEVITGDPKVRSVLINIFGGITRCDLVAQGILDGFSTIDVKVPVVVRLDGTSAEEGRAILAANPKDGLVPAATMLEAASRAVELAKTGAGSPGDGLSLAMAIIIDENTRVVVQGLTGREGRFHALRNRDYGTKVVAGVTPGKGGTDVEGIPVFDTVVEAVNETGANASIIFVPARFAADAVYEAADSGVGVIVCITEGVPAHDEARFVNYVHRAYPDTVLIGPNCPGLISPGKCNIGHHARRDHARRRSRPGGAGVAVGHADLPGRPRADPAGDRPDDLRRHRRRPGPGDGVHRLPVPLRGRPRHEGLRDDRRDRRLRRGDGGGLHRLRDDEAGGGLRGRGDRPAGEEDGPRRRHRLRFEGHGGGQDRSPGKGWLPRRAQSVRNRRAHGRGAQEASRPPP